MASEMVERVARALFEVEWGSPPCDESAFNRDRDYWTNSARAAIAAMREPSTSMLEADMDCLSAHEITRRWQAMIDAALS